MSTDNAGAVSEETLSKAPPIPPEVQVAAALTQATKALDVLFTMLRKAAPQGASVADEINGEVKCAQKNYQTVVLELLSLRQQLAELQLRLRAMTAERDSHKAVLDTYECLCGAKVRKGAGMRAHNCNTDNERAALEQQLAEMRGLLQEAYDGGTIWRGERIHRYVTDAALASSGREEAATTNFCPCCSGTHPGHLGYEEEPTAPPKTQGKCDLCDGEGMRPPKLAYWTCHKCAGTGTARAPAAEPYHGCGGTAIKRSENGERKLIGEPCEGCPDCQPPAQPAAERSCAGTNCTASSANGFSHSEECIAQHDAALRSKPAAEREGVIDGLRKVHGYALTGDGWPYKYVSAIERAIAMLEVGK